MTAPNLHQSIPAPAPAVTHSGKSIATEDTQKSHFTVSTILLIVAVALVGIVIAVSIFGHWYNNSKMNDHFDKLNTALGNPTGTSSDTNSNQFISIEGNTVSITDVDNSSLTHSVTGNTSAGIVTITNNTASDLDFSKLTVKYTDKYPNNNVAVVITHYDSDVTESIYVTNSTSSGFNVAPVSSPITISNGKKLQFAYHTIHYSAN